MGQQDGHDGTAAEFPPPAPAGRGLADNDTLAGSLAALAKLSVGNLDLTEMLTQVATLAVVAIPGADGAGLTLLEIDRADLIVKSEPFVRQIDEIQYSIGEGPCISAAAAMNVYARRPNAFDDYAQWCGESFAVSASMAVQNAQILDQTARLVEQLQTGLKGRGMIDQAVGILRRRGTETADEALEALKELSRSQQISLTAAAVSVLEGAVRRGRAADSEPTSG